MNLKIEFRFAVLNSLLSLLWLATEYLVGLQDKYISLYPYVAFFSFVIPVFCIRYALKEKTELLFQKITFGQAFRSGLIITVFATIFIVPVDVAFLKLINTDFLDSMINYGIAHGQPAQIAQMYFDIKFYVAESAIGTFISGLIISLILARLMRTK